MLDIVTITVCAVLSGADTFVDLANWGRARQDWLRDWLVLPHGIPSHDTFGRVFARLDPDQIQHGFLRLVHGIVALAPADGRPIVALDGKTVRRSGDRPTGQAPLHRISAWAVARTDNEISTLPTLLRQFALAGQIVTIDAIGCQTALAARIIAGEGDYVLALEANQEDLFELVRHSFAVMERPEAQVATERAMQPGPVTGQAPTTAVRYSLSSLPGTPRRSRGRCGVTGGSKTACTGCWTWGFGRTRGGPGRAPHRRTWRWR